jgi:hypothetical protein
VADGDGKLAAWLAGVSGVSVAFAALTGSHGPLFIFFTVIASVSFAALLITGGHAGWTWWHTRRLQRAGAPVPLESGNWAVFCEPMGSGILLFKLHSTLATPSPESRVQRLGQLKCRVRDPNGAYTESQVTFKNGGWVTAEYRPIYFPDMLEPAIAGRYEFTFYEQQSDADGSWLLLKSGSYDAEMAPEVWE